MGVGAGDDCGDAVQVDRLVEVILVPDFFVLRGESLSVRGCCCVINFRAEEQGRRRAGAVECPILCDASRLIFVDDEGEAPGSSSVPGCFESPRDLRDLVFEDIDGPVLRCSHDAGKVGSVEPGLDHRVDGGGARCSHGAHALGSQRGGKNT